MASLLLNVAKIVALVWISVECAVANNSNTCKNPFDLILVVEDTSVLNDADAEYAVKDFLVALSNHMVVGPDNVQIGLQFYNDQSSSVFYLNRYKETTDVMAAILLSTFAKKDIPAPLDQALQFAHNDMLSSAHGERSQYPAVIVVVSYSTIHDSNARQASIAAARQIQDQGALILSVGVGPDRGAENLIAIANDVNNYYDFNQFADLANDQNIANIANKICNYKPDGNYYPCDMGSLTADLVFVVDVSQTANAQFTQSTISFMSSVLQPYQFGKTGVQAALVTYAKNADVSVGLTDTKTIDNFMQKVTTLLNNGPYGTGRYISNALDAVLNHVLNERNGYRPDASHTVYIISSQSFDGPDGLQQANLIRTNKSADIHVIALGQRSGFWKQDLDIAGDLQHFYNIKDNAQIILSEHLPQMVWRNMCYWREKSGVAKGGPTPNCPQQPTPTPIASTNVTHSRITATAGSLPPSRIIPVKPSRVPSKTTPRTNND